ncbi:MAG TPA: cellulase family glycosylhydrolase [Planosporangium sp.]|nr:cellulase family glycosylhydrolase [Planosporangium sp.]
MGALLLALIASSFVFAQPAHAATGMRVKDGRLVEANGHDLVLRGINHAYTWYSHQNGSFAAIKAAGANSVRLSLAIGHRWKPANTAADVSGVIALCKQNRLICVLDAHDTMGYGQQDGAASMDQAVEYWISVQSALAGQENYVILNVADEPFGYNHYITWTQDTTKAIQRLRGAGFQHTLMVDAPDWGQDLSFSMRDNATKVLAADPARNIVFDVHMYGVFDTSAKVQSYLQSFVKRRLPLVVGEFSDNHPYGKPADDAIMAYTQRYRLGFLGWSWSGNTEATYLDMVKNFNPAVRTPWGVRFLTGVNGLRTNAQEATVFGGGADNRTTKKRWRWADLWPWSMSRATAARAFPAWPASPGAVGVSPRAPHLAASLQARDGVNRSAAAHPTARHAAWPFVSR